MLVQDVFCLLLPVLSSFDPNINKWIRSSRLNKPKGMLNYIVNYLKQFEDIIVLQKLQKFGKHETEICTIISNKISDLDKKNKIISLMDGDLESIPKDKCCVCKQIECVDLDFCDKKKTNWEGI